MRAKSLGILIVVIITDVVAAQEQAKSRITSVGLFKNGLAVVKREVSVPGPGFYHLDALPDVVHGTFWVESNAPVEVTVRQREVAAPTARQPDGPLQDYFAGKQVVLHFANKKLDPIQGTVPAAAVRRPTDAASLATERFFIVRTKRGHMYINPGEIAAIETNETDKIVERRPSLVVKVGKSAQAPMVQVSYLAQGLAWAPSYRMDISNPKQLAVEMATVLRNEMEDLEDAEVSLISGFPSVEFAEVSSPLEAQTTWTKFFQQVSAPAGRQHELRTQKLLANTMNYERAPSIQLGAIPAGEGVDLHFEPVGKRSLGLGEAMAFNLGQAKANYERIVEWTVGTSGGDQSRRNPAADELWDVIRFKNPFKFPLTTAPALIVENGRFNGQRTCYWTNVGEETSVKITKSLSLRTASSEEEDKSRPPERVALGRRDYTRLYLKGALRVNNHRDEAVKLLIHYSIRGEIIDTEGEPRIVAREGSLTDVNPIRDVMWTVTLAPGQEKELRYRYHTLVDR